MRSNQTNSERGGKRRTRKGRQKTNLSREPSADWKNMTRFC